MNVRLASRLMMLCAAAISPVSIAAVAATNSSDSPKCSPPIPRNISLAIAMSVDGGGAAVAGSSGTLEFTIRNLQASGGAQPAIISHFPDHGLPLEPVQPVRIAEADIDACFFTEQVETIDGEARIFYTMHVAGADPGGSTSCRVSFDVADAVEAQLIEWKAEPFSLCSYDPDRSDNTATVIFGNAAGLLPAQAVPASGGGVAGWFGWAMLLLAFCVSARRVLRA